jgi:transglutaminase-like putative cysteine protease
MTSPDGDPNNGEITSWSYYSPIVIKVTNTQRESGAGSTDKRFLYPSYVVQSDDFRITNLASELTFGLTDTADKVKAIHDYLVSNTVYDAYSLDDSTRKKQDAITVLGKRYYIDPQYDDGHYLAVCEGYANVSAALLRAAGIETKYVSSDAMSHGWNNVYVNGWKFYDATWDDPVSGASFIGDLGPSYIRYKYFLLNDMGGVDNDHYDYETDIGRAAAGEVKPPFQKGIPDGWY